MPDLIQFTMGSTPATRGEVVVDADGTIQAFKAGPGGVTAVVGLGDPLHHNELLAYLPGGARVTLFAGNAGDLLQSMGPGPATLWGGLGHDVLYGAGRTVAFHTAESGGVPDVIYPYNPPGDTFIAKPGDTIVDGQEADDLYRQFLAHLVPV